MSTPALFVITCIASWYGPAHRSITAYGEPYHGDKMTCAADAWPRGTVLELKAAKYPFCRHKPIFVTVNDRLGPASRANGRKLDLSPTAFRKLAPLIYGLVTVQVLSAKLP
jgi:rare lipoprotein A (peptidoglycan hydrolase)